jgi:hypothetical protein|tara:strand:- start:381 stop:1187 length:807 start_codon:yes stop_codon:yes gene_type:complete
MNSAAVNLGAGGFVSYFEDGGAAVTLGELLEGTEEDGIYVEPEGQAPELAGRMDMQVVPERGVTEQGLGTFFKDQLVPFMGREEATQFDASKQNEMRASGRPGQESQETYYPEGQPFFEKLEEYGYPAVQNPVDGPNRHARPMGREDMPTPQELEDARAHALGTGMVAREYGPNTAMTVGNMSEDFSASNRLHRAMDKRNNAVGASLIRQSGINLTPAELASQVDATIFKQLEAIMQRDGDERRFESPKGSMDLYFPRDKYGYFISDH